MEIERQVRGSTAGFNTPTFVTDVPGGGGKRDLHSFDHYDEETGISIYRSPAIDADRAYVYFDPIHRLPAGGQARWADERQHDGRRRVRWASVLFADVHEHERWLPLHGPGPLRFQVKRRWKHCLPEKSSKKFAR